MSAPRNGQGRTYANLNLNATLSSTAGANGGGGMGLAQAPSTMMRNGLLLMSKVSSPGYPML
jgi:hypothetical protein